MTKIYRRDNTVQYLGYYLVEFEGYEYIFHRYDSAMHFCWEHDLDPNKEMQTNSPEVFDKCKKLAVERLRDLDILKESIKKLFEDSCAKNRELAKVRDKCESKKSMASGRSIMDQVDYELAQEAVIKQVGKVDGVYEAMHLIDMQRDEYFGIVYNCTKWGKK